ncbi:MAG: SIMPL domain-containing protein [Hyphomonadaceae bacterium]|nr:SIMPL domain-containing protein [Hyphomonadaceae bacterium]
MRPIAFAAVAAALSLSAAPALAQAPEAPMPGHRMMMPEGALLTVSAEGEAEVAPDLANISLGVVTEGQTAAAAMQANAQRMAALVQSLRRAGVAERDVQTANVSVNPQYVYGDGVPPRITGYQASNTVNVRVRNLANLGRTVDAAVAAGGNTINGVSFSIDDPEPVLDRARRQAVQRARARANLYAEAAGMRVNRIISISEAGAAPPMPYPVPMMMAERSVAAQVATPTMPGEVKSTANVTVVFELR